MLMLISPAKTLNMDNSVVIMEGTQPAFISKTQELLALMRQYSVNELMTLMDISEKLAMLNVQRYREMSFPFTLENAKQAVFAFHGDVYEGLAAEQLSVGQVDYLQEHLLILSGLYGALRPLDLMQAYRLEMGTALPNAVGKDLYAFWGNLLQIAINKRLAQMTPTSAVLVNLASEEYAKAAKLKGLSYPVITPIFQDEKAGNYKIVSFYAKKARGLMVRYAAQQGITQAEDLKGFNVAGYAYCGVESTADKWVFRRAEER